MGWEYDIIPGVLDVLEQSQVFEIDFKEETLIDHLNSDQLAIIGLKFLLVAAMDGSERVKNLRINCQRDLEQICQELPVIDPKDILVRGEPWDKFVTQEDRWVMTMDQKLDHLLMALSAEWPERAEWFNKYVATAKENGCGAFHIYSWLIRHMLRACICRHWCNPVQGVTPSPEFDFNGEIGPDPR